VIGVCSFRVAAARLCHTAAPLAELSVTSISTSRLFVVSRAETRSGTVLPWVTTWPSAREVICMSDVSVFRDMNKD
jgi:hypothetical protein